MVKVILVLLCCIAGLTALPASDPILSKWDPEGLRFSYMRDDQGNAHLVDHWLRLSDLDKMARYSPDSSNQYHLFTRQNPTLSQPLVLNDEPRVRASNFNPNRRTVMLMHGFMGSVSSTFNSVLVPAFLAAGDCNVIVLDWSAGSWWGPQALQAGAAAGRFITWLNAVTGSNPSLYHIVGFSVGGHGAGHIARNVIGNVGYVTGLDPAERWEQDLMFRPDDGSYTEIIHTSTMGEIRPLGQVDFYPNGGTSMPGCLTPVCNHDRSFYFLAESLQTGGFTGQRCVNLEQALAGTCTASGILRMGGFEPKTGNTGIFHLRTNFFQPFSQG